MSQGGLPTSGVLLNRMINDRGRVIVMSVRLVAETLFCARRDPRTNQIFHSSPHTRSFPPQIRPTIGQRMPRRNPLEIAEIAGKLRFSLGRGSVPLHWTCIDIAISFLTSRFMVIHVDLTDSNS